MRYFTVCMTTFLLSVAVLFWSVFVISGYVSDYVRSYGGPTPMALDTAICIGILAVVGVLMSLCRIKDRLV